MSEEVECESEFTIRNELGLHARPAGQFVILAGSFKSEIKVSRGGSWVDGRSVLSLLSLAAASGTRLRIRAVGEDAEAAVEALGKLLENPTAYEGTGSPAA